MFGHAAAFKAADLQVSTRRGASCKRRTQTKVTFEFFLADQTSIWFFYKVTIAFHLPDMCQREEEEVLQHTAGAGRHFRGPLSVNPYIYTSETRFTHPLTERF